MDVALPRKPHRLCLALTIALGASAQASADSGGALAPGTSRATDLDVVRVIGNPEDPQSSMGSAYTLTTRELEKFERSNINNILRSVPGVYTREETGQGVFPRISIRASSSGRSDRISVLEDGIPAAMAPYANTSAYFFPNVGRMHAIEVLKGPEILQYGPQTTSGVINLLSTPIPDASAGALDMELGAFGNRRLHASYGATAGQWGVLLETYQANGDGFLDIDRTDLGSGHDIDEYVGKLRWASAPDATYAQQVDIKLNYDVEQARVSYLGQTDADFRADPNRRYGLSALERMDRGRKSASAQHQFWFDDDTRLTSTAYWSDTYRYYNRLNQINGVGLGGVTGIINTNAAGATRLQGILDGTLDTSHANGVRYGHNHQDFESRGAQLQFDRAFATGNVQHDLTLGARWHQDLTGNARKGISNSIYRQVDGALVHVRTDRTTPQEGEAVAWSAWAADRIRLGQWSLLPILRHERIRTEANLSTAATPAQIAARATNRVDRTTAGFGVNYAVDGHWTLLGGVHQGSAPPGNNASAGTRGEESTNLEGGLRYRSGDFGVDAIGFLTDYQNAMRTCLVANPCTGGVVDGTEQTGSKDVYGLEVGLFASLYAGEHVTVPVRLAYTWTDGEYTRTSDTGNVRKGDVIEYTPRHIGSLQVGLEGTRGWRTYAALNYNSRSYTASNAARAGVDSRFLTTDSLFTVDLSATYPLSKSAEIYARVDNLLDAQKITHRGADGARGNAPRGYGVGLRLTF